MFDGHYVPPDVYRPLPGIVRRIREEQRPLYGSGAYVSTATQQEPMVPSLPIEEENHSNHQGQHLHVTEVNTAGITPSIMALPANHSFVENDAGSDLSWRIAGPAEILVPRAANNHRHAEREAEQYARNVLRVYGRRR
jgi:hypothetical protein